MFLKPANAEIEFSELIRLSNRYIFIRIADMTTVFSGIQPTGTVHLGNLLGAIKNWATISEENKINYFCIVDLHSITTIPNKEELQINTYQTFKALIGSGINLNSSTIYIQSQVQEHAYLSWILSSFCQVGELQRMTQFKEKSESLGTHSGLLTYPILMAADILLHKAEEVPVGDDQTQHLELTRNIAERFNQTYSDFFPLPTKTSGSSATRVMSLRHPDNKMSKSTEDLNGTIYIDDSKDLIMKKFKTSVTDSENEIKYDIKNKPGISNLIEIFSAVNNQSIDTTEKQFAGVQYGEFKLTVGESVASYIIPIYEKINSISDIEINKMASENRLIAKHSADKTISEIKNLIGLV